MTPEEQHASEIAAALSALGEHTFRKGSVLVRVSGFYSDGPQWTVENAYALYEGVPVALNTPLHFVNALHNGQPVEAAYDMIAGVVRRTVGV